MKTHKIYIYTGTIAGAEKFYAYSDRPEKIVVGATREEAVSNLRQMLHNNGFQLKNVVYKFDFYEKGEINKITNQKECNK